MKDLQIPNGYFHLWQSDLKAQNMNGLDLLSAEDSIRVRMILEAPIDQQSSYELFKQIIEETQQKLERPQLVFEMARHVKAEHFGVLGYMATRSESIAEALQYILRFNRLVIDGDHVKPMQVKQINQDLILSWPFVEEGYCLINELTNAMMIELARKIVPLVEFPLKQVAFAHPPRMALYHYRRFYGCDVVFEQHEYSLVMGIGSLDLKLEQADPSLMQLLIKQAEEAIASKPFHQNIAKQLHLIIAEYLKIQKKAPKIEEIAQEFYVSVRTLQRQLNDLDTSFKQILEIERMALCEKLLEKGITLSEIAMQLGYSDQSALARAYKTYNGQTLLQRKHYYKQQALLSQK